MSEPARPIQFYWLPPPVEMIPLYNIRVLVPFTVGTDPQGGLGDGGRGGGACSAWGALDGPCYLVHCALRSTLTAVSLRSVRQETQSALAWTLSAV